MREPGATARGESLPGPVPTLCLHLAGWGVHSVCTIPAGVTHGWCQQSQSPGLKLEAQMQVLLDFSDFNFIKMNLVVCVDNRSTWSAKEGKKNGSRETNLEPVTYIPTTL